ncbi:hypothetical protein L596_013628 [Steinernema carpocapsae]|uniref:Uncharacterized protein n=1 Tax=Steinernema carpocapsae TaxID=34508 RepID=A0A4U5P0V9_STECR|nr:hypothetical protein L596_013628 [Steinernema carpocapsae]
MYGRNFNRDQEWRSMLDHEVIPALPHHPQPEASKEKKRASAGKDAASKPKKKKDKKKPKVSRAKIPAAVKHEPRPEPEGQPEEVPRLSWTPEREYASVCLWRGGRILRQYQGRRMPPAAEREFNRLFAVVYEQEVRDMEDRVRLAGAAHPKPFIVEEREDAEACREGDTVKEPL